MTVQDFISSCGTWLDKTVPTDEEFTKLLSDGLIVLTGTQPRDIAVQIKIDESTVFRWVQGSVHPHPAIQRKVINILLRMALLESA